jgi:putative exosortase-associated protein (TIGR04073 family)
MPKTRFTSRQIALISAQRNDIMRNIFSLLAVLAVAAFASGCANMENKLGRGFRNSTEFVRLGDIRRSMEQAALLESPEIAYTSGAIRGFNRSLFRTGVGIYEIVTFPLPPYRPVFVNYLPPEPVYPDCFRPGMVADSSFATDTSLGFSGGDVAPFIPGSRFKIFETH